MTHLIKSEFQKLATVRSTYYILAMVLAILAFVAFYLFGYRGLSGTSDSKLISSAVVVIATQITFLVGLLGVLLVTHEYRYNTIMYTLTSSNSRLKTLLAKVGVVSVVAVLLTLAIALITGAFVYAGAELSGRQMAAQEIWYLDLLGRLSFYGWAYSMLALLFAVIIRSPIGTIVTVLFVPGTVEGLLGIWLKDNVFYLPFSALFGVLNQTPFSHEKSILIVLAYVIGGWLIAGWLFKKRDAN